MPLVISCIRTALRGIYVRCMNIRESTFRRSLRNVQHRPHRLRRCGPQQCGLKAVPVSRTKIPSGQITLKLTVEGADVSFLDALRSALPEIRAVLPVGHRFDVTFIDASAAMTEIGGWCSPPERCRELTPRQREILDLLATGLSNKVASVNVV